MDGNRQRLDGIGRGLDGSREGMDGVGSETEGVLAVPEAE